MSNDKTNNYKEVIMSYFSEDGHEFPTPHHKQGHELAKRYFETRLDNTLKQYNDNSHRAFDFYSIKKNLHLFTSIIVINKTVMLNLTAFYFV